MAGLEPPCCIRPHTTKPNRPEFVQCPPPARCHPVLDFLAHKVSDAASFQCSFSLLPCSPPHASHTVLGFAHEKLYLLTYMTANDFEAPLKLCVTPSDRTRTSTSYRGFSVLRVAANARARSFPLIRHHWLSHYHRLGVRPNQTHVAFRVAHGLEARGGGGALTANASAATPPTVSASASSSHTLAAKADGSSQDMPHNGHTSPLLRASLAVLSAAGVPLANVQRVHADQSDDVKIRIMNARLAVTAPRLSLSPTASCRSLRYLLTISSSLRLQALLPHERHIYADVDELFDYPCSLRHASPHL